MVRKRKLERYRCRGYAELHGTGGRNLWGQLGDICSAGFYVSTLGPWPINTEVNFRVQVDDTTVTGVGVVGSTNPGVGMTIIFREMPKDDEMALDKLIERLAKASDAPLTITLRV